MRRTWRTHTRPAGIQIRHAVIRLQCSPVSRDFRQRDHLKIEVRSRTRGLPASTCCSAHPNRRTASTRLLQSLGPLAAGTFTQAAMHTPTDVTERALSQVLECSADCTISFGGGSSTGLGKAIALRTDLTQIRGADNLCRFGGHTDHRGNQGRRQSDPADTEGASGDRHLRRRFYRSACRSGCRLPPVPMLSRTRLRRFMPRIGTRLSR